MRALFPIIPNTRQGYLAQDVNTYTGVVPTANTWDDTTNRLGFQIHVPAGERWLTHFDLASYIQGPNVPTYNTSFGLVLKGATQFQPVRWGGPGSYSHVIAAAGDAAWGACNIPLWLNPGITVCNFAIARDAGAITVMRRQIKATPYLGMKL